MESELKVNVFHSEISRVDCEKENHLYDLLQIEPAKPVSTNFTKDSVKDEPWDFRQSHDKHYSSKRAPSKFKVKTVSEIRAMFEKDVYTYLQSDLELQQNYLLRKICDGYSNDEKTRNTAIKILNSETPISRSSWQMLSNINPERHNHSKQFVLWNGRCIQVNGSKGGKNKFISKHDLKNKLHNSSNNTSKFKKNVYKSKARLLQNSLNVKFKPGPLAKKQLLDSSHHRYQMGKVELVKLPLPVLEVSPAYGTVLDSTIANFVNNMRGEKGVISKKLAEFAVSVLGTINNSIAMQSDEKYSVTFELNYKCKQNRLLMRRNTVETTPYVKNETSNTLSIKNRKFNSADNENTIVKQVMDEVLDSVVISLNQDTMYFKEDEPRNVEPDKEKVLTTSKDKYKRKYCELDKLDVTIINIPESCKKDYTKPCGKSFCTLGCVCESLDCGYNLKQHCGVIDCMFGCKCRVTKYKGIDFLEDNCDMLPGLMNLDNEINSRLAKEEKKFHQTVIFSGDKSILLKSRKRNWKSSKKYAEFFSKMNLKGDDKIKKVVTVDVEKLCCENIESLCMVHNLYKCFCKGKFIDSYVRNDTVINTNKFLNSEISNIQDETNIKKSAEISSKTKSVENSTKIGIDVGSSIISRLRTKRTAGNIKNKDIQALNSTEEDDELSVATARTMGYHGRQYDDSYYIATNKKIAEMEQNDVSLKTKMLKIIYRKNFLPTSEIPINNSELLDCETLPKDNQVIELDIKNNMLNKDGENKTKDNLLDISNEKANETVGYPFPKTSSKGSLKTWLEFSYKSYKERIGRGLLKNSLEAPKKGKASLQRWDFILSRYSERKNMFFVSNEEPYRTFLAVDNTLPLLANCINIDDIRFADLPKYPMIIRNLVTNATDSENVFCILRGWDNCWELIGSAVKVIEKPIEDQTEEVDIFDANNLMSKDSLPETSGECEQNSETMFWQEPKKSNNDTEQNMSTEKSEKSKWFILTVENDFTEIQFYKKGFYVTYDGIQRSINLARISGKTVRLSARTRTENPLNNSHPYGIYAIPRNSQSCVFIGPYEVNEPLGIEVIKSIHDSNKPRKTRGMWINTNKVDNKNVIDNPLAYLPSAVIPQEMDPMQTGNTDTILDDITPSDEKTQTNETSNEKEATTKQIKPIKIRRTNGFYHLSSKNALQKMTESEYLKSKNSVITKKIGRTVKDSNKALPSSNIRTMKTSPQKKAEPLPKASPTAIVRPVAEVAPQIKITHVYSEKEIKHMSETPNKESTMHVLKPEEINKKVAPIVDDDIEKFLETSTICIAPQEVLVISDTEDDVPETPKYVWIQSSNVENFGYIRAKMNKEKTGISFEFPGFKYSDYYSESEAFYKINQVLARKMYIPKNVKLQWEVIHEEQNLTCGMLTTKCLEDKKYLLIKLREQRDNKFSTIKSLLENKINSEPSTSSRETPTLKKMVQYVNKKKKLKIDTGDEPGISQSKDEQIRLIEDLEETSNKLEQQSDVLWNEAVSRRNEIFGSLTVPDNIKNVMTKALQEIMARHENDDE